MRQAVVVAARDDTLGGKRRVAYVVGKETAGADVAKLVAYLEAAGLARLLA